MLDAQDGGPAFPHSKSRGHLQDCLPGMSLRDWFAGQAIIGIAAYAQEPVPPATLARAAYGLADAMIAARKPEAV